jgi:pyruvate,orthophosphate dikinase
VARGRWARFCLVGCADLLIDEKSRQARLGEAVISEGDLLCLDGDAGTIYADSPKITSERPKALITRVEEWRMKTLVAQ